MDGTIHDVGRWDLIVGHPPCTYLSNAGAIRLFQNVKDGDFQMVNVPRLKKGILGRDLLMAILNANCDKVVVENPVPSGIFCLPKYTQIIHPYQFGEPYKKQTCLWIKGLPLLQPTEVVEPTGYWIGAHGHDKAKKGMSKGFRDSKTRSKTVQGIAKAMAEQWG